MIKAPYIAGRRVDPMFEQVITTVRTNIHKKDDDFMIMCGGSTGTGKSSLMFHAYEAYDEQPSINHIGVNQKTFATALKNAKEQSSNRFCANDEANISKRGHATRWNKELLDLYFSIRGLQIFHWWNNPSLEIIDKPFIEERIKGFIYIYTKDMNIPRQYYYFRRDDLLKLYLKHGNLKLQTLRKHGKRYAYYQGWFRKYNGSLWKPYLELKDLRMGERVEDFYFEFGDEVYNMTALAKLLGVSDQTIRRHRDKLTSEDKLINQIHYKKNAAGYYFFTANGKDKIEESIRTANLKPILKT